MKFVSWNILGIGSQAKRTKVLNHLTKLQADICLLQETHLCPSEQHKLKRIHVYSATYKSRKRGVSILINKTIPLMINSTIIDLEGGYIIIHASLFSDNCIIANVYSPNNDHPFFSLILLLTQSHA